MGEKGKKERGRKARVNYSAADDSRTEIEIYGRKMGGEHTVLMDSNDSFFYDATLQIKAKPTIRSSHLLSSSS